MRSYLSIFILFLILVFRDKLSAQSWSPGPFPSALDSFYTRINNAELFIAEQNIPAAITSYRKASEFKSLDYIDRLNLLQCFLETQKITEAVSVIIQMAEDHYGLVFLNDKKYIDIINDDNWIYYVEHNYKEPPHYPLRDQIIAMNNSFKLSLQIGSDSVEIIKQDLKVKIINMFLTDGYPSEQELGYGGSRYYPSLYNPIFYNVLFSAFTLPDFNADSILTDQFTQGKLSRELYIALNANLGRKDCGCEPYRDAIYLQYMNKLYSCTKQREDAVNKKRKELLLPNLSDEKKLIEFQTNIDPDYKFRNEYNIAIFITGSDEIFDINEHTENLELVKILDSPEFYFKKKD